jgi:hypothetical protein
MLMHTAILNFQSTFVDEQKALEKKQAEELQRKGLPVCLGRAVLPKHVEQHLSSFLRFMVDWAVTYYKNL